MYSFILFKIQNNTITSCDYLSSPKISNNNYNFSEEDITMDKFLNFMRPLIANKSLNMVNLKIDEKYLANIYNDLRKKEYQIVTINNENKLIKVFKIPNYELEQIKKYKNLNNKIVSYKRKEGKVKRINLFTNNQLALTSLSTILLLSGNIANYKTKGTYEKLSKEKIIETQEDIMNTQEINNLIDKIKHVGNSYIQNNSLKVNNNDFTNKTI